MSLVFSREGALKAHLRSFLAAFALVFSPVLADAASTTAPLLAHQAPGKRGGFGPAVTIDPGFAYYSLQPWSETLRLIREAGLSAVQIVDTGTSNTSPERLKEIITACREAGVSPVLKLFPPTDLAMYKAHPEWRQKMLGDPDGRHDWRVYLCLNRPDFVSAYCAALEEKMRRNEFDGIQFAEVWLEQWGGPRDGNRPRRSYACVCDHCVADFRSRTGVDARDMLTSPTSPVGFERPENRELYRKWVDFRVEIVTRFAREIASAARRGNPRATVDLMILSDARVEAEKAREYQAIDVERLLTEVKPDIVTIQDAWQDWMQPDLKPDFVVSYARAYRERIRKLLPNVLICSHADIGSLPVSKRSPEWIGEFARQTVGAGLNAPTFYEWSVSRWAGR